MRRFQRTFRTLVADVAAGLARAADRRRAGHRDAERLRVLSALAVVAQGGRPLEQVAQAVTDLAVRQLVDLCVIDVVGADGRLERVGASLHGERQLLDELLAQPSGRPAGDGRRLPLPATTIHLASPDVATYRQLPYDERERGLLARIGLESVLVVPLVARGRPFGRMLLGTRAPRRPLLRSADVEYAQTLAGRTALALENAALSTELSSTERQLEAILESVDAAITVRDVHGRMVYANRAAADLLRLPDLETVKSSPPGRLMDLFDVFTEAGDPVALDDLPGSRLIAGESAPDPVVVRNVVKDTGEERWLLNRATAVTDAGGRVLMAVNLIEDVTSTKRSEIAQRLLANAARQMAEASDLTTAFQAIAAAAVPGLADWAGVDIVDQGGRIATVAVAHRDPEKVRLGWQLRTTWPATLDDPDGLALVIRTGQPQLISEVSEAMLVQGAQDSEHLAVLREVGLNSIMIAPIRAGERILGALSFVSSTSRRFDARDLELASDLGRQTGVMINSAQLAAEQAEIARTLQAGLIPESLPVLEGWEVSSAYRAAGRANEVGGDFYDVVRFPGGWAAVIGDVLGKGAAAASLTALARHTVAAIIESTGDVAHALEVLNRRLRERGEDFRSLCTLAVVELSSGPTVTVYSAGHPLPLLAGPRGLRQIGAASPMLGFLDEIEVVASLVEVGPGEQIVLYTDGVLDAVGSEGRLGEHGLEQAVQRAGAYAPQSAAQAIMAVIDGFLTGEQSDDIAILSLTRALVPAPAFS